MLLKGKAQSHVKTPLHCDDKELTMSAYGHRVMGVAYDWNSAHFKRYIFSSNVRVRRDVIFKDKDGYRIRLICSQAGIMTLWMAVCLLVRPPLWSRLKCLNIYKMNCHEILSRRPCPPEDESYWLWSSNLSITLVNDQIPARLMTFMSAS